MSILKNLLIFEGLKLILWIHIRGLLLLAAEVGLLQL
jgi:hypothetical protein